MAEIIDEMPEEVVKEFGKCLEELTIHQVPTFWVKFYTTLKILFNS